MLARRPLTGQELRSRLERRGHTLDAIEAALDRLVGDGHVDDGALALEFILLRSARLGHGRRRLLSDLERRGVDRAEAARAWQRAVEMEGLDPEEPLHKRVRVELERCGGRLDLRAYRRVYNSLLRAGFDAEAATRTLSPHRGEIEERGVNEHDIS